MYPGIKEANEAANRLLAKLRNQRMATDIKARIEELNKQSEAIRLEIEKLQGECPHPEFEEGLSMVACIHPVLFCTTCWWSKPMPYHPGPDESEPFYTNATTPD